MNFQQIFARARESIKGSIRLKRQQSADKKSKNAQNHQAISASQTNIRAQSVADNSRASQAYDIDPVDEYLKMQKAKFESKSVQNVNHFNSVSLNKKNKFHRAVSLNAIRFLFYFYF